MIKGSFKREGTRRADARLRKTSHELISGLSWDDGSITPHVIARRCRNVSYSSLVPWDRLYWRARQRKPLSSVVGQCQFYLLATGDLLAFLRGFVLDCLCKHFLSWWFSSLIWGVIFLISLSKTMRRTNRHSQELLTLTCSARRPLRRREKLTVCTEKRWTGC